MNQIGSHHEAREMISNSATFNLKGSYKIFSLSEQSMGLQEYQWDVPESVG